ncbi:MAG: CapA family protein, partial [Thiohalorhabdaceae bacterium]
LTQFDPDRRIINLETAVTCNDRYWRGKSVHYRMHPENARLLSTAGMDACTLANNHVLDWCYDGLADTLDALQGAGVSTAGAGESLTATQAP